MDPEFELVNISKTDTPVSRPSSSYSPSSTSTSLSTISLQLYEDLSKELPLNYLAHSAEKTALLPCIRQFWLFRFLRHIRYVVFTTYRLIFLTVLIANLIAAGLILGRERPNHWSTTSLLIDVSDIVSVNFMVAILIRQDYIINMLFKICLYIPLSAPVQIRQSFTKIYHYGGLHSGAAVCSVLWFSLLSGLLVKEYIAKRILKPYVKICTSHILGLLWAMVITAYPQFRFFWHNMFEHVHRWAGWLLVILFWSELLLLSDHIAHHNGPSSPGAKLKYRLAFWCHLISSFHIILPWLRLRKLPIEAEHLSSHTIRLHFKERVSNCVVYRISSCPLGEWHSFACIPERNGVGGSLLISNAGDWTRKTINSPKRYYYTRGLPTAGVLCMAQIFRKVVIVTTGSGIGPCLGTAIGIRTTSCRVLWSAPSPQETFGDEIYNAVLEVDSQAVIIDTRLNGRPDMVLLAYELYMESGAEAIFCISNRSLTRKLVYDMECRGLPAYGPIWDS